MFAQAADIKDCLYVGLQRTQQDLSPDPPRQRHRLRADAEAVTIDVLHAGAVDDEPGGPTVQQLLIELRLELGRADEIDRTPEGQHDDLALSLDPDVHLPILRRDAPGSKQKRGAAILPSSGGSRTYRLLSAGDACAAGSSNRAFPGSRQARRGCFPGSKARKKWLSCSRFPRFSAAIWW